MVESRHSPLRTLIFSFYLEGIPSWVSVHLCRHVHAQPYVQSQRNDRQDKYDRSDTPQNAPVNMVWEMNAEELLVVMNKRLCKKASAETRNIVLEMKKLVARNCPEFESQMIPMCQYHGGICHEFKSCEGKE